MMSGSVKQSHVISHIRNNERRQKALKLVERLSNPTVTSTHLDSAISYLKHIKLCEPPDCPKVRKRCHIRPNYFVGDYLRIPICDEAFFVKAIRDAIISHKWDNALDMILLLVQKGKHNKVKYLVRVSLQVVLYHPNSSPQFLFDFFQAITKYSEEGDIEKFILMLFRLKRNNEYHQKKPKNSRRINVVENPFYLELLACDSVDEN